ncbi:unnamed protein product [Mucor hiemalis]
MATFAALDFGKRLAQMLSITMQKLMTFWTTTRSDYELQLRQLGCQPLEGANSTWTLPSEALTALNETKRNARSEWHTQRQFTLKKHLDETLELINSPLDITNEQRLALTRQFMKNHEHI